MKIAEKKVTVSAVILDDQAKPEDGFDRQSVVVEDSFEVKATDKDLALRLGEIAKAISGRARSIAPDGVVVRRADRPQRASNLEGPRLRLLAEGAITAAVHEVVHNTVIRSGKDCGAAYGDSKSGLEADAETVLGGKYGDAAAAALSGLAGNRAKS